MLTYSNRIISSSVIAATIAALLVVGCGSGSNNEGNHFTVQTLEDIQVLADFSTFIETVPRSTNITAQWLSDGLSASGNVKIFGPLFTNFRGLYTQNDARLPAQWRVQANSGPCTGQFILTSTPVNNGDFVGAWCKASMHGDLASITVSGQTFDSNGNVVAQACCNSDTLYGNPDIMHMGDYITSADGRFAFAFSGDGYLNIYEVSTGNTLWWSSASAEGGELDMQTDGNLVLYSGSSAVWATGTEGHPGAYLVMQNDGNLVLYDSMGSPLWATNTCCH
jgi:hypothetical protein